MKKSLVTVALAGLIASTASAHSGRRLEVKIVEGRLATQGYISGSNGINDGAGFVRRWYDSLHDHWSNTPLKSAIATLPGFDVFEGGPLTGHNLDLTLTGASRWLDPPLMPPPGTIPELIPIGPVEIVITYDLTTISTSSPGTINLVESVDPDGATNLDLYYEIDDNPVNVIYVLEFQLSTDAPGIASSKTVHIQLSPDGSTPAERLHHASLYLEQYLGTPIPCDEDLNFSGLVDFADLVEVLVHWGEAGQTDLTGDGTTDLDDLVQLLAAWGPCGC